MKFRLNDLLALVIITPLGFSTKFYQGPFQFWISNSLGGVLYEIFWCLVVAFLLPKLRFWKTALGVFIATSLLEVLQLSDAAILEAARSYFIGKVVLGTSFIWSDFFYYAIGCLIGLGVLKLLAKWA